MPESINEPRRLLRKHSAICPEADTCRGQLLCLKASASFADHLRSAQPHAFERMPAEANSYVQRHQEPFQLLRECLATCLRVDVGKSQLLCSKVSTNFANHSGSIQPYALEQALIKANSYTQKHQQTLLNAQRAFNQHSTMSP